MRTLQVCLLMMVGLLLANSINAQNEKDIQLEPHVFKYKNVIKIHPIQFFYSTFQVSYERYFNNRKNSIVFSPGLILKDSNSESFIGFTGDVQVRFYLSQLVKGYNKTMGLPSIGFYTAPYVQTTIFERDFNHYWYDHTTGQEGQLTLTENINSIGGGLLLGLQFDLTKRIVLDMFAGGGFKYSNVDDPRVNLPNYTYYENYNIFERGYTGVLPKAGILIGFNF